MKGIRKLFFGLVLLTLFGVGFKVDAKAAPTVPSVNLDVVNDWNIGNGATALSGTITVSSNAYFPDKPSSTSEFSDLTYSVQIKSGSTLVGSSKYICLSTENRGETAYYHYGIAATAEDAKEAAHSSSGDTTISSIPDVLATATKQNVLDVFGTRTDTSKTFTLHLLDSSGTDLITPVTDSKTVEMYKVTPTSSGDTTVTFSPTALYLLPGESDSISATFTPKKVAADGSATVYKYNEWEASPSNAVTLSDADKNSVSVKLNTSNAGTTTVTQKYGTVSMSFSPDINTNTDKLDPGEQSGNKTITVTATDATAYNDENILGVTVGGENASHTWSGTTFTYTVPSSGVSVGTNELDIEMDDGNVFYRNMTVNQLPSVAMSTVKVTRQESVSLSKYITGASETVAKNTDVIVTATSDNYVTVSPSGTSAKASNVKITGKTVTAEKDGLIVNGDTKKVIVYSRPTITLNASDSGYSLNSTTSNNGADSPFKVTMPVYVYHDDVAYAGVNEARIAFIRSGSEKTAIMNAPSSISSTSTTTAWTAPATSITVSEIIDDLVGDGDRYTITVRAYPVDPDNSSSYDTKVYAEEEITAYRISLDGSGGAKYTVNGTDVGDHFYAIKGTTYSIASKSKNGEKFNNWDDNVFSSESGGTYKVLGARTFKANYGDSNSSPSSSTGRNSATAGDMDDYDDVPKTGESKADIWILWSVLFVSILGAGFMIWKRFGLVRAIAEADEEVAAAEHKEEVKARKKEKEDKLKMLKDLRNL